MLDEIFCPQLNITYKCNLTCSYCYEQEFAYKDKIMNLEEIKNLFVFFNKLKINEVTLIGGEPTEHPEIDKIFELAAQNDISIRIFTHGLFSKEILNLLINSNNVKEIYIHITHQTNNRWYQNIKELFKINKDIWFRVNFSNVSEIDHAEYIISKFKKNRFKVGYSLSCPFSPRDKNFIPIIANKKRTIALYKRFFDFISNCVNLNISVYPGRPLPVCQFTKEEWDYLVKIANAKSTCNPIDDINFDPGYYVKLCSVIKKPRYKLNVLNEEELKKVLAKLCKYKDTILNVPSDKQCSSCYLFPMICQGGCYAHKIYQTN